MSPIWGQVIRRDHVRGQVVRRDHLRGQVVGRDHLRGQVIGKVIWIDLHYRMDEVVVPLLEEVATGRVPEGKLGSEADFIQILGHYLKGSFKGIQGDGGGGGVVATHHGQGRDQSSGHPG